MYFSITTVALLLTTVLAIPTPDPDFDTMILTVPSVNDTTSTTLAKRDYELQISGTGACLTPQPNNQCLNAYINCWNPKNCNSGSSAACMTAISLPGCEGCKVCQVGCSGC
ncbi:hypothetical protein EJ03DRAFT_356226 [Teratosphaeria nubilosa]|uniref:Uncharacterized protein n=1 Tax=Teratosphaeria nubilosa TaxID=161662 RepID=A0A6G1KTA6_9PEZI|nr:hypothetical protein EJ03DRAFT_356226 [Teratosphaeria nubilosa]